MNRSLVDNTKQESTEMCGTRPGSRLGLRVCAHLPLVLISCLISGCGPGYYLGRIEHGHRTGWEVAKLGDFPDDQRARSGLVELLTDEHAAVRCAAIRALRDNRYLSRVELRGVLNRLSELLSDDRVAAMDVPLFPASYLAPVQSSERLGSVRSQALLSLTMAFGRDYGFDQAKWRAAIVQAYGCEEDSPSHASGE